MPNPIYQEDLTWLDSNGNLVTTNALTSVWQTQPRLVRGFGSFSVISAVPDASGDLQGNLAIWLSNASVDKYDHLVNPADWTQPPSLVIPIGQSINSQPPPTMPFVQQIVVNAYNWMCLAYTPIAGSGTLHAKIAGH